MTHKIQEIAPRMMAQLMLGLLLCVASVYAPLSAAGNVGELELPDGRDADFEKTMRERAATFRLKRAEFYASEDYNEAARRGLENVKTLLQEGAYKAARKVAKKTGKRYPYSDSAAELLHNYIRAFTPRYLPEGKKHKINGGEIYLRINDLWLRYPDYPHMRVAFMEVLIAAEAMQNYKTVINVHAETVIEAVQHSWNMHVGPALDLYNFLDRYGDKHVIGPRAKIGIARVYLIQGSSSPKKLLFARGAYIQFLSTYPKHELVFDALIERAYCYLIAYRGDKYDTGVLMESAYIIRQAELYSEQREDRVALIQQLRTLIRRSHQDRDFQVAIWYDEKKHTTSAIYYYKEVIKRDPNSASAKESVRALERLEQ